MNIKLLIMITLIVTTQNSFAESTPWPTAEKAAAIAGCRQSIYDGAERDYLKRSKQKQLPPDFREKTAVTMEPILASCDCMFAALEKQMTYDYFVSNQDHMEAKVKEIMSSGDCVPDVARQKQDQAPK